ncbi:MAG TPA: ABC transporter substrate-binding protein [Candidatus Binatia bacterium]|nr:ABC transporter substrate-binding protein [Candidatus Binatia bacterium]
MKTKILVCAVSTLFLTTLHLAQAQQAEKVPRIGLLVGASTAVAAPWIEAFRQSLRELGYVEGKDIVLEIRGGQAKPDRLSDLAAELVRLKVDIIVAGGGAAVDAVKEATSTIPIVMRYDRDPVRTGVVASLAHPGGNITGLASITVDLSGKRFELLSEAVPGLKRIAVLTASQRIAAGESPRYKELEAVAQVLGVKLQILLARDPAMIDNAFLAMKGEQAQALIVMPSVRYIQHRERIIKHAAKHRLPAIYFQPIFVENGGLMSYGPDFADEFRRMAVYVDKILKGTKPADLPVERPVKFEFIVNLQTAEQIGLTIPPNVLARANRVIQ